MKHPVTSSFLTASIGLCLTTGAHASYQPAMAADPITTWTPYADTGGAAPLKHSGAGVATSFVGFTAPVIFGDLASVGSTQIAFKGYMARAGTVATANDEGIWSNADPTASGSSGSSIWMVAQEGDNVTGAGLLGFGGSMTVKALQTTTYGGTLFNTNSNANIAPNFSVYEGGGLTGLAGAGLVGFPNGGLAVAAHARIAVWTTDGTNDGTRAWDVSIGSPGSPHTVTPAPPSAIHWSLAANPRVQCSPAISYYGAVAHRARSLPSSGLPWDKRDYIEAVPLVSGGFFLSPVTVVRAGDPAPTGEIFGIFHPVLMAIAGGPNIAPTVAWQMSTMNAGETSGSTLGLSIPYGTPMPHSNSLWCWRPGANPYAEIARAGQAASEITGRTIKSFYALHLVDDDTTWPNSVVFYGAILDNGKYAIYLREISGSTGPVLGTDQLIATDAGGPPGMDVPAIYGPPAITYPIASLYPWFSVDIFGNVLMKATLGGAVQPGQKQCLLSAKRGPDAHGLRMRAQSNSTTVSLPTLSHGVQPITNFTINAHEQGTMGRGQSIFEQTVGALISFPGGSGIFAGF